MATTVRRMPDLKSVLDGLPLTPVRPRKSRPSLSPVKQRLASRPLRHSQSQPLTTTESVDTQPDIEVATAALNFEEFSFFGADGNFDLDSVSDDHHNAFLNYLMMEYGATVVDFHYPFIVIGCKHEPSEVGERPFSIAGMIAIWRKDTDMDFWPVPGEFARGEPISMDREQLARAHPFETPPEEFVLYVAEKFPDCIGVSFIWDTMVIELPPVEAEYFARRLQTLPSDIEFLPFILLFHNGEIPGTARQRRATTPNPEHIEDDGDTVDYVSADGRFYPGAMLASLKANGDTYTQVTAGILVEKDGEQRLTCSYHNWEDHHKKYQDLFGSTTDEAQLRFAVQQGTNPGTRVGFVRERVGNTDIALAQLLSAIQFDNSFMEMSYRPKRLVRSREERRGNKYVFDAFTTGRQAVVGLGSRFAVGRYDTSLFVPARQQPLLPPTRVAYIVFEQGVFATNQPIQSKPPHLKEGCCGAVLLKCKDVGKQGETEHEVMDRGEIVGMLHFADLLPRGFGDSNSYLCFAEAFDPLIEAGWAVVQSPTLATREEAGASSLVEL